MKEFEGKIIFSISHTTRNIRENEKHGVNYYYVEKRQFEEMISKDEFVEWASYNGNYYGTSKMELNRLKKFCEENNSIALLELDIVGAKKLNNLNLGVEFIAILPPSFDVLRERLLKRGTDDLVSIENRLKIGKEELDEINNLDYIKYKVINENLEVSINETKNLVQKIFPKTFQENKKI